MWQKLKGFCVGPASCVSLMKQTLSCCIFLCPWSGLSMHKSLLGQAALLFVQWEVLCCWYGTWCALSSATARFAMLPCASASVPLSCCCSCM
jgi:hypothetical protein